MRRIDAMPVVLTAVLPAGCQAGSDSTNASDGKKSGGFLGYLRQDPITIPEGATFAVVLETGSGSSASSGRATPA